MRVLSRRRPEIMLAAAVLLFITTLLWRTLPSQMFAPAASSSEPAPAPLELGAAKTVEHPRNRAGVAAQLGGFALEPVNLLDHLDGDEDMIVREIKNGVGIVEEDIGIKNVVFHARRLRI